MLFIHNKYTRWYYSIISNASQRILDSYYETHHIIPKSLGGSDDPSNLCALTAREHFICHVLLTKMTEGSDRHKMLHASIIMKGAQGRSRYINSRLYESMRAAYAEARSISMKGRGNHRFGTVMSEETKHKISQAKVGKPSKRKGKPGTQWTDGQRNKMKLAKELGSYCWWTDGVSNIRAPECPVGYRKGRTMSPDHLAKFK